MISISPSFTFYIDEISFLMHPKCYWNFADKKPTTEKQMPLTYIKICIGTYTYIYLYMYNDFICIELHL